MDKSKQRYTRLTAPRVARIKAELASGKSQREVARAEGVSGTTVHSIANGLRWAWIQPQGRADVG